MIKLSCFIILFLISSLEFSQAEVTSSTRGYLSLRVSSYTEQSSSNYGQYTRTQIEQSTDFSPSTLLLNQLRFTSNSEAQDLSSKTTPDKKDLYGVFLGENYFKIKQHSWVMQIGYQDVVWGEAFGLNYADIVNPKDQKLTFYDDLSDARLPLLMINTKSFFTLGELSGSIQLLYSPEPRYSKTLPVDMIAGSIFPQGKLVVTKESTPSVFKKSEIGEKISTSYQGFDTSLFHFTYMDRNPFYSLKSMTLTEVDLLENHNKINSTGLSFAKTLSDYVLRSDVIYTDHQTINYLEGINLKTYQTKVLNALLSLDTPSFNDYSGIFIFARSNLSDYKSNSFRTKTQEYGIAKISKNLGSDKTFDLSYTHEFKTTGHGVQALYKWPVNNLTELHFGGEFYSGNADSSLHRLKNTSSLFITLKNYFQL